MLTLLMVYVAAGLLLAGLSIPLIQRRIPPNGLYGFRVKATLENTELWYAVNAYSGKWLLAAGLCTAAGALGLYLVPGLTLDAYAVSCLGIFGLMFTAGLAQSVRKLRHLSRP